MSDREATPEEREPAVDGTTAPRRRSARILLGSLVIALVIGVAVAVAIGSFSEQTGPRPPLAASQSSAPDAEEPGDASAVPTEPDAGGTSTDEDSAETDEDSAEETLSDFLTVAATPVAPNEVAGSDALQAVASGAVLNELEAESLELEANKWVKSGVPAIVWIKTEPVTDSPGRVTVEACLDTSSVSITTRDGEAVSKNSTPRAINVFTLEPDGDGMRVIARTFPDNPSC